MQHAMDAAHPLQFLIYLTTPPQGERFIQRLYVRRCLLMKCLIFFISIFFGITSSFAENQSVATENVQKALDNLEKSFSGKIGVYAMDTNNNQIIAHRADELFPMQSTLKFMVAAALLQKSNTDHNLLQQKIQYSKNDLTAWNPIAIQHVHTGMTLEALAEAAVSYSDNAAANLLIKKLGGPLAITKFAHSIGNTSFQVEHYEGNLNSNPENNQDSVTPQDMALSIQKLLLGDGLAAQQKKLLLNWMQNNTTGYKRIRAGVPLGWTVADKTGSGDYGVANDVGLVWFPGCKPVILAIYTVRNDPKAKYRDDIAASVTAIILDALTKQDSCFQK